MILPRSRLVAQIKHEWLGVGLFILALGLRAWGLSEQPLWLDEIFSIQLVREGPPAILRNSLSDPHPPLFYLLQWLGSGFGAAQSEWGWRWISVLCGALTIPAFYNLCQRFTGRLAAGLAGLVLAASPFHIYYSQEGRAYAFTALLVVYSSILVVDLLTDSDPRWRWSVLTTISLVGLFSNYFYLLVIAVQGLILFIYARPRTFWMYTAILSVGVGLTALLIVPTVGATAQQHAATAPLTLQAAFLSLAGEPVRFTIGWQHRWLMGLISGLALLGTAREISRVKKNRAGLYFTLQLLLPALFIFSLGKLFSIRLPYYETRQVMIFTPALFALSASGLDILNKKWGWWSAFGLCIPILAASIAGLLDYWGSTKSAEGSLAQSVFVELQTTDMVVSLDYWTTAGAYSYLPRTSTRVYSGEDNGVYQFNDELRLYPLALHHPHLVTYVTMERLRSQPRLWTLTRNGVNEHVLAALTEGCRRVRNLTSGQFTAVLWEDCQP